VFVDFRAVLRSRGIGKGQVCRHCAAVSIIEEKHRLIVGKMASSSDEIRLDANGNIDTTRLEASLKSALDFDVHYKQTDNMKKRAVKVAKDYDEFKAMVACAHLKTLSRQEIETLQTAKKGWAKTSGNTNKSEKASILSQESSAIQKGYEAQKGREVLAPSSGTFKKPKTPLEFERDFRRLSSDRERIR
jgi:Dynein attachment factor N-terminus